MLMRRKQRGDVNLRRRHPLSDELALHMLTRDDDGAIARQQTVLLACPAILPHERARLQLATVPGTVERKTRNTEPPVAWSGDRKSVMLLSADAGSQIAV